MNKKPYAQTAQGLASMGRYGDSMLVHMTPGEVAGLQSLAQANGTSLTINPKTGLPEAFILAPLVGLGLKAAGMSALGAGIATGLLGWAVTGDLGQGLLSGLGGYGGAGLGGALGKFGAGAQAATPLVAPVGAASAGTAALASSAPTLTGAVAPSLANISGFAPQAVAGAIPTVGASTAASALPSLGGANAGLLAGANLTNTATLGGAAAGLSNAANTAALSSSVPTIAAGTPNIGAGFSKALADPKAFYDAFPNEALTGLGMAASPLITSALQPPGFAPPVPEEEYNYEGPYFPTERVAKFPTTEEMLANSRERQYFADVHPYPGFEPSTAYMAEGGIAYETADAGSDPGKDAIQARNEYGLGGLANFARGGEIDYGLSSGSGSAVDPNSIPSVEFSERLANYDKKLGQLTRPKFPFFGFGSPGLAMYASGLQPGYSPGIPGNTYGANWMRNNGESRYGQGLSRAEAEARLGARPVWNPQTFAPPTPIQQEPSTPVGGGGITQLPTRAPQMSANPAMAGFKNMASGIMGMAKGGFLDGPGDGMSDSIPATIAGKQPARLADGEFVVPADVVSHLGNGSTKAGAKRLYAMMDKVRHARTGTKKQGKQIKPEKYMPA